MSDIFNRGLDLFTGIIYRSITSYPTFMHIKSIFRDEWYNFIIPNVSPDNLNWDQALSIINSEKEQGYLLSYYIPDDLFNQYIKYFKVNSKNENIGSDFYIAKHIENKYSPIGNLVLVDDTTIQKYVDMAKICFPEWETNKQYAMHMYEQQKINKQLVVRNYLLKHDNNFVGFCGMISSQKNNLAYFHNTGVLPKHRRKGYFAAIIQHLVNLSIPLGISDTYAIVENESGSYHGLIKLGFIVKDKYHLFST